ncbi:transmembrane amino acid transporter protein-domain-containing protein [Halenospora varia]|nr:transmembrane amino acid transporter protein-domain-containing protein [Halenospora varia]
MHMQLDFDRYPCKSYEDVAFRIYGGWARYCVNVIQSLQLLFIVAGVVLSSGQSISQISKNSTCYIVCILIYALAGIIVRQIRTLQRFGWLANLALWLKLLIMFIVMGLSAPSVPSYQAALASYSIPEGPVVANAGTPPGGTFVDSLNGLNQAVYSYGSSMMFCEFMSQMRRPTSLWKSLIAAQAVIYFCYVTFGMVVYSIQGQFAFNPAMQGLSPYNRQTAVNIMFLFSGLITACLYGNVGVKVMYVNVLQELFNAPPLTTKKGKWLWVGLIPIYWALAFVICVAIPHFSYISGLVGAVYILQFTNTFPPIPMLGSDIKKSAILPLETFDTVTRSFTRTDDGITKWARDFMQKGYVNAFNVFFVLGAATTAILGIYSSVVSLIAGFEEKTIATSFRCAAPV